MTRSEAKDDRFEAKTPAKDRLWSAALPRCKRAAAVNSEVATKTMGRSKHSPVASQPLVLSRLTTGHPFCQAAGLWNIVLKCTEIGFGDSWRSLEAPNRALHIGSIIHQLEKIPPPSVALQGTWPFLACTCQQSCPRSDIATTQGSQTKRTRLRA